MTANAPSAARTVFTIPMPIRGIMLAGSALLVLVSVIALVRGLGGWAPTYPAFRELAIAVHVVAVLPAVPLGLYVMLSRKGDARHRLLGKIWMGLMLVTALSALFIRHLNSGQFSWIHLFVPLVIVTVVRSIAAARAGRIAAHRRQLIAMYIGALLIPGLFSFLPGRMMGIWLFG
jgi:uncharacterized membrane protein